MWLLAFERPAIVSYHCCTTTCCLVNCRTRHVWHLVRKPVTSCSECMYLLRVLCLFFLGKLFKIRIDRQMVIRTTTYLKRRGYGDCPNCERRKLSSRTIAMWTNIIFTHVTIKFSDFRDGYISSRALMMSPPLSRRKNLSRNLVHVALSW